MWNIGGGRITVLLLCKGSCGGITSLENKAGCTLEEYGGRTAVCARLCLQVFVFGLDNLIWELDKALATAEKILGMSVSLRRARG